MDLMKALSDNKNQAFESFYIARINELVEQGRESLIPDLTAEYSQLRRTAETPDSEGGRAA
jgi:hypothetical protein